MSKVRAEGLPGLSFDIFVKSCDRSGNSAASLADSRSADPEMEGIYHPVVSRFISFCYLFLFLFFPLFSKRYFTLIVFFQCNIAGEAKHNIDELVDDLKRAVRLDATQENECSDIVEMLDSIANASKTLTGGINIELCQVWMRAINLLCFLDFFFSIYCHTVADTL